MRALALSPTPLQRSTLTARRLYLASHLLSLTSTRACALAPRRLSLLSCFTSPACSQRCDLAADKTMALACDVFCVLLPICSACLMPRA